MRPSVPARPGTAPRRRRDRRGAAGSATARSSIKESRADHGLVVVDRRSKHDSKAMIDAEGA
jgi:hypothetical protein